MSNALQIKKIKLKLPGMRVHQEFDVIDKDDHFLLISNSRSAKIFKSGHGIISRYFDRPNEHYNLSPDCRPTEFQAEKYLRKIKRLNGA